MCQLGVAVVRSEKLVAEAGDSSGTQRKNSAERRYQAKARKDSKDFMRAIVTTVFEVCNSVRVSQLFVVTIRKFSINPNTNQNLVSNHTTRQHEHSK
jgi:hypothetical protein